MLGSEGRALPSSTRARMERAFGRSLDQVRVQDDARASEVTAAHSAQAVAIGPRIAFAPGKYRPGTESGDRLIAHELAHVVQGGGGPRARGEQSEPTDVEELEAEAAAGRAVEGKPAGIVPGARATTTRERIMRRALEGITTATPESAPAIESAEEERKKREEPQPEAAPAREPEPEAKAKPEEPQAKPEEPQAKPEEAQAKPEEAKAKPEEAKAKPEEAKAKPEEAKAKPEEAKAKEEPNAQEEPQPKADEQAEPARKERKPGARSDQRERSAKKDAKGKAEKLEPEKAREPPAGAAAAPAAAKPAAPAGGAAAPPIAAGPEAAEAGGDAGGAEAEPPEAEQTDEKLDRAQPQEEAELDTEEDDEEPPPTESEEQEAVKEQVEGAPAGDQAPEEEAAPPEDESEEARLAPGEQQAALEAVGESAGGGGGEGGGGGGGGGGAIPDREEPAAPATEAMAPESAIATAATLQPKQMVKALGGAAAAVTRETKDRKQALAESPPSMEKPTGLPAKSDPYQPKTAEKSAGTKVEKAPEKAAAAEPVVAETPAPPPPASESIRTPDVGGGEGGGMSSGDAEKMQAALQSLPTSDPALSTSAGPAPAVALEGDADPAQVEAQRAKVEAGVAGAQTEGRADVAEPQGEDEIAPVAEPETLTAKVGGAGESAAAPESNEPDEETAIIAEEKSGDEIRAKVAEKQDEVTAAKEKEAADTAAERERTDAAIQDEVQRGTAEQTAAKQAARTDADASRAQWSAEQTRIVDQSRTEADAESAEANQDVTTAKETGDREAGEKIEAGEEEAVQAKQEGEREAEAEKAKGNEESSGIFGWLASKAKAFFDGIKKGIQAAIAKAREAVKWAIDKAKKLAVEAIERARKTIVAAIRLAGDALIAIGDVALAAFPEARERFRQEIQKRVQQAEDAVNQAADALKKGVTALLDMLGEYLDQMLGLLEKALLAIVDAANAVVQAAIKAAEAVAKALGGFLALIKDIAAGPGQWISNLGAAVVDGIKNHLVKAMKKAISEWFNQKLEEILGLGTEIFKILMSGGITIAQIGKMAWEALKAAIPAVLIQILIEKLVSMIVPAAGAIMVIIEGLQAAWGTVSRILAAIDRFIGFLKAVKGGNAGPQFGEAVAAAAIAVIDFVANWLLRRLIKPAKKVGGKIKAIAQKILAKIKKAFKKIGKALKKAAKKIKKLFKGKKGKSKKGKDKNKKKDKKKDDLERLERAVKAMRPALSKAMHRGIGKLILKARLGFWKMRYRLKAVDLQDTGKGIKIVARVNPETEVIGGVTFAKDDLLRFIREVSRKIIKDSERPLETTTDPKGRPVTIVRPEDPLTAQIAHKRGLPKAAKGTVRRTRFPSTSGRATEISSKQGRGDVRNQVVSGVPGGVGQSAGKAEPYLPKGDKPGLAAKLQDSPSAAADLERFAKRGREVGDLDQDVAAEVMGVLIQEGVRADSGVAQSAIAVMTAKAQGEKVNFQEVMKDMPMQRSQARRISEQLDRHLDKNDGSEPKGRTKQMRDDQVRQIKTWIEAMGLVFTDEADAKQKIEQLIREFWGLTAGQS